MTIGGLESRTGLLAVDAIVLYILSVSLLLLFLPHPTLVCLSSSAQVASFDHTHLHTLSTLPTTTLDALYKHEGPIPHYRSQLALPTPLTLAHFRTAQP